MCLTAGKFFGRDRTMKNINLHRLQSRFIQNMIQFSRDNKFTHKALAAKIRQNESILCDILNNKRVLSALYLLPALEGGIMTVDDIYDGQPETPREAAFWARQRNTENPELMKLANRIIDAGGDPIAILELQAELLERKK